MAHPATEHDTHLWLVPDMQPAADTPAPETVAEFVGAALARLGAVHCFGMTGAGNAGLTSALSRYGVCIVPTRQESAAVTMADAHARMTGTPGLVCVDAGSGLANAATGLAEAAKSRTPVVVLAAESPRDDVHADATMDQDALIRSVHATPARVHSAATAARDIVWAWRTALNDRRTVVLNVPVDVQDQPAPSLPSDLIPPSGPARIRPDASVVTRAAQLLGEAVRPVLVAGRGARHAETQIARLAEHTGALLATSVAAKGLFNGNDFDMGVMGVLSSPTTAELLQDADLVMTFGCTLNPWTTQHGNLINPGAHVVQVDVEDAALGAHHRIDVGLVGDSAETARALLFTLRNGAVVRDGLRSAEPHQQAYRTDEVRGMLAAGDWRRTPYKDLTADERIDPRTATKILDQILPLQRVVTVDAGNFMGYPSQFLGIPDENGFCFTQAFNASGLGLPTAIGAGLARTDRIPVLGTGDGGFHRAIAELDTAVRLRLPVVCIVYNDAGYEFRSDEQTRDSAVTVRDTDFVALARGFGAEGITVRRPHDLEQVRDWVEGPMRGPLVIDLKIASDGGAWWVAVGPGGPRPDEPTRKAKHRRA